MRAAAKATAENHSELTFRYLERGHQLDVRNAKVALEYAKALLARGQSQPALAVVAPFATMPEFQPLHARALLEGGRLAEAEPRVWAAYDADAKDLPAILDLIGRMVDAGDDESALRLMHRVEARETQRKRRRDFIVAIKDLILGHPPRVELLRYLSELLNSANREQDYCDVLGRLFDLYYASGEFARAGDALDRAGEVDPYDPANQRRLDMLRGKLDAHRFHTVAARFGRLEQEGTEAVPVEESAEPTVLEDLMLQAEIFLRYNMRTRALERLERINRLFPKEEHNNAELRDLYERGSYVPESGQAPPPAKAASPAAAKAASPPAAPAAVPPAAPATAPPAAATVRKRPETAASSSAPASVAADPLARVADVARNLHRQTQLKNLLFGAVNDIGRCLEASRCIAALYAAGKPPSGYAEYCAPGIPKSSNEALLKAIEAASAATANQRIAPYSSGSDSPLAEAARALGSKAVLACSLFYRDEVTGVLLVADSPRTGSDREAEMLQALADQLAIAAASVRLRRLVESLSARDERSGLLKRTSWFDALVFQVASALEQREPLTLALMQLGSNASLRAMGEAAAEALMLEAAQLVGSNIRQADLAVRYDRSIIGLAFAATDENAATLAIAKLRRVLSGSRLLAPSLGITCGIAQCGLETQFEPADIVTEVVNRAQSALEAAWAEGGNTGQALPMPALAGERGDSASL